LTERAVVFSCEKSALVGIVHEPEVPGILGVVIIVAGGPQYRVGAHRQFVLLARKLASEGVPVIRFDHRGTGDSDGNYHGFNDMGSDIRKAVDLLFKEFSGLEKVALWGECESASAAAYYGYTDNRVHGLFLVNPWVRTDAGLAKTYLKHHYRNRFFDPRFWRKVRAGRFSLAKSLGSMTQLILQVVKDRGKNVFNAPTKTEVNLSELPLTQRLEKSLLRFNGGMFVVTSGRDHIAQEYRDFVDTSLLLKKHMQSHNVVVKEIADADHTFSRAEWRRELFDLTQLWLSEVR